MLHQTTTVVIPIVTFTSFIRKLRRLLAARSVTASRPDECAHDYTMMNVSVFAGASVNAVTVIDPSAAYAVISVA